MQQQGFLKLFSLVFGNPHFLFSKKPQVTDTFSENDKFCFIIQFVLFFTYGVVVVAVQDLLLLFLILVVLVVVKYLLILLLLVRKLRSGRGVACSP